MRKCYISKNYKAMGGAGDKAKTDIEASMLKAGFINLGNKQTTSTNMIVDYLRNLVGITKAMWTMKEGDVIVLQYPWKKYFAPICKKARKKGVKTITVIHDLGSFRRQRLSVEQEIGLLNLTDHIVAHNDSMKRWIEENGISKNTKISSLGIFDYLSDTLGSEDIPTSDNYKIAYAGNLHEHKNRFIYDLLTLQNPFSLELYGVGFEPKDRKLKTSYKTYGYVLSDELITNVRAHFGLVWDGDTIHGCGGTYGEYLRYNNPHKTSLYIRCNLPVIVWTESALAPFVTEKNIGIAVDSLDQLPNILANLSKEDYKKMKENTIEVSKQLANGYYITQALDKAIELFD